MRAQSAQLPARVTRVTIESVRVRHPLTTLATVLASVLSCAGAPANPPEAPRSAAPQSTSAASPSASADWPFLPAPADRDHDALVARLTRDPGPIKSNWVPPHRSERYGRAEGLIQASYGDVRARLLDFAHYGDLAGPKFSKVRVVDKKAEGTDVYFNLPIMRGLVRIWYIARFHAPRPTADGEVLEGVFVKGNVKDTHFVFTLHHGADDRSAILTCDMLLVLNVPAPQSSVDEELRDACGDAINSVRRTTANAASAPQATAQGS